MLKENILINDVISKKIFIQSPKYVKSLIEEITEKKISDLKLIHPSVSKSKALVNGCVDLAYETEDAYYNIEINKNYSKKLEKKNMSYIYHLGLRDLHEAKDYEKMKMVIQININNYDRFKENEIYYPTKLINERTKTVRNGEIEIYDINLEYLKKVGYNNIKKNKLMKYLYIFVEEDNEKIKEIMKGDEIMEELEKIRKEVLENFDVLLYYDKEKLEREIARDEGIDIGRTEGINIGRTEGRTEGISIGKRDTANNLIKEGIDLTTIAKATNININELKQMAAKISV